MSSHTLVVAVSPNGGVHAVREGAAATACGLDYGRQRLRNQDGRRGWLRLARPFTAGMDRACKRCVECLAEGMGPGAQRS